MTPYSFLLVVLAVFYITHALLDSNGPWDLFLKLREKKLIPDCGICLSFWAGISVTLIFYFTFYPLVEILAAAGAASFLYAVIQRLETYVS